MDTLTVKQLARLDEAVEEAYRFIGKAEEALEKLRNDKFAIHGCRETAAAKRASMDLTNALVRVRRSIYEDD